MKILGNSINAAVLIVLWMIGLIYWLVQAAGRFLERRLAFVAFGDGPSTAQQWLEVLLVWVTVYFLITVYF